MRFRFVLCGGLTATLLAVTPLRVAIQASSAGDALGVAPVLTGVVAPPVGVTLDDARLTCPAVIASSAAMYEIQGPHGDARLEQRCVVVEYRDLGRAGRALFAYGRYRVTSVFAAEDSARGREARDSVPEEVVVLFRGGDGTAQRVALWQMRYEVGSYGALRSMTPQVADGSEPDGVLLRIEECVNGTGGCGQDFLHFRRGTWTAVEEVWWGQLPAEIRSRVHHGVHIDARTLHAEAGLYGPDDPNCCPSDLLTAQLRLVGDNLILENHHVQPWPR